MPPFNDTAYQHHRFTFEAKQTIANLRRDRRSVVGIAVSLIILALFAGGVTLLLQNSPWVFAGVPLVAEAMILAWYLGHECAHNLVFSDRRHNDWLGEALSWINGGAYFAFEGFKNDHLRHHAEQVDLVGVDSASVFASMPSVLRQTILALERAYLPAAFFVIKSCGVANVLRQGGRLAIRAGAVTAVYAAFYATLIYLSPLAFVLYLAAIIIRIHCVRFVDAFQHDYEHVTLQAPNRAPDRVFEQRHTFSFPVARKYTFLNYLILNFGFHNAHHAVMTCPWYNLIKLDGVLTNGTAKSVPTGQRYERRDVPLLTLMHRYHIDRVSRITAGDSGSAYDAEAEMAFSMRTFSGGFTDNLLG